MLEHKGVHMGSLLSSIMIYFIVLFTTNTTIFVDVDIRNCVIVLSSNVRSLAATRL